MAKENTIKILFPWYVLLAFVILFSVGLIVGRDLTWSATILVSAVSLVSVILMGFSGLIAKGQGGGLVLFIWLLFIQGWFLWGIWLAKLFTLLMA